MLRSNYMQKLMTATYSQVPIIAILEGFDGAWEKAIAERLESNYKAGNADAKELLYKTFPGETFIEIAYHITASEIPENIGTLTLTPEQENEAVHELIGGGSAS